VPPQALVARSREPIPAAVRTFHLLMLVAS
jgi:hypothetical protein